MSYAQFFVNQDLGKIGKSLSASLDGSVDGSLGESVGGSLDGSLDESLGGRLNNSSFFLELEKEDLHHFKVLRIKKGERIAVIDAQNVYYLCEVLDTSKELPRVRIASHESCGTRAQESKFSVSLAVGLGKSHKLDDIIRHATELGVNTFIPLECARSVSKLDEVKTAKKIERWQSIAKSAAMQSGAQNIPQIDTPCNCKTLLEAYAQTHIILFFWEEEKQSETIREVLPSILARLQEQRVQLSEPLQVLLVIGPEGGFDGHEVSLFQHASSAYTLSLGKRILRMETAAISASALVISELEHYFKSVQGD